jgi:hypothetical protein
MYKGNTELLQEMEKATVRTTCPNRISNQVPHECEFRRVTRIVSSVSIILTTLFQMKIAKDCEGLGTRETTDRQTNNSLNRDSKPGFTEC